MALKIREIEEGSAMGSSAPLDAQAARIEALRRQKENAAKALKQAQAAKKLRQAQQAVASANRTQ